MLRPAPLGVCRRGRPGRGGGRRRPGPRPRAPRAAACCSGDPGSPWSWTSTSSAAACQGCDAAGAGQVRRRAVQRRRLRADLRAAPARLRLPRRRRARPSDPCVNTPPADAYWGLFWSDGDLGAAGRTPRSGVGVADGPGRRVGRVLVGRELRRLRAAAARAPPGLAAAVTLAEPVAHPTTAGAESQPTSGASPARLDAPTPTRRTPSGSGASRPPTQRRQAVATADPSDKPDGHPRSRQAPRQHRPRRRLDAHAEPSDIRPRRLPARDPVEPGRRPGDGGLPGWVGPAAIGGALRRGAAASSCAGGAEDAPP